ncbi:hypothetical protein RRG08_065063 [Elysia crispata]|uniref:Uncharacterized protein n=1 Tax=Elysia crispata TaxID=231223 RepID=A0AAE0YXG8_9GAST|nr:hypothetical protein RRG08_065063 [Elysia crispata]
MLFTVSLVQRVAIWSHTRSQASSIVVTTVKCPVLWFSPEETTHCVIVKATVYRAFHRNKHQTLITGGKAYMRI